ncbi:TRAP transporter small permease subunit [Ottowia sp. VDI28]|uniref:TRAP transporter small permease subunit n=1 Tax=Ottowia sp. VDI28 TaxID=3133968 RepID=UPI003C304221
MQFLLTISRLIDQINLRVGRWVSWTILAAVVVSSANALSRKFLHSGSNAWLELQGYLFGALFLLASGYTLLKNGHVRVDVLSSKLSPRAQTWIEIMGTLLFLLPAAVLIMVLAWPMFWDAWVTQEGSPNAGGLIRWPAKLLVPVGFTLLVGAGISHLIKCIGFLRGLCPDPTRRESAMTDEEKLAAELKLRLETEAEAAPRKD